MYECTVNGGSATIFRMMPNFTDCSKTDNMKQDLVLLHSQFYSALITCNNNSIVGHSLKIENGTDYISQLEVTFSSELVGGIIECLHDDGTTVSSVGNITITSSTAGKLLLPIVKINFIF